MTSIIIYVLVKILLFVKKLMYFSSIILFLLCLAHISADDRVDVNTGRGPVFGYHFTNDLINITYGDSAEQLFYGEANVFLGIPFVEPPIGNLRFKKPKPIPQFPSYPKPHNATYFRLACPQETLILTADQMSEDCLYLNIFSPKSNSETKYPVFVWIHGGALKRGFAAKFGVPGVVRNLVSRGIVVVTIQYRIGLLGFFTTFTDDFPPNLGMLDQIEALKFVREEIKNFGGDPNRVTIGGQSAGAASVSAHTYSHLSKGLFQQTIQQSGAVLTCFEGALGITFNSFTRAQALCNYTKEMWDAKNYTALKSCLSTMDYNMWTSLELTNMHGWKMVVDGDFLPDVPKNLYKTRPNIPRMIGVTKDEWAFYELASMQQKRTKLSDYTREYYKQRVDILASSFLGNYTNGPTDFESVFAKYGTKNDDHLVWLQTFTDTFSTVFTTPTLRDIDNYLLNNNSHVYAYEFTYPTNIGQYQVPGWHPVPHSSDLFYIFMIKDPWMNAISQNKTNAIDLKLADFFGEAWANFVKTGKPSNDWKPITTTNVKNIEFFEIGLNPGMRSGFLAVDNIIWNRVLSMIAGFDPENIERTNSNMEALKSHSEL